MKRKYLIIILIIFVLLSILLGYYIFTCIDNLVPIAEILEDSNIINNYILGNEEKDNNLKTFVAVREICSIDNKDNMEFYGLVLIDSYNIENQLLEHNQSVLKLYKIIFKDGKIISSDDLNVENISSYDDYNAFPKNIIMKYLEIKDSVDLTEKIKKQIDNYYNETNKQSHQ